MLATFLLVRFLDPVPVLQYCESTTRGRGALTWRFCQIDIDWSTPTCAQDICSGLGNLPFISDRWGPIWTHRTRIRCTRSMHEHQFTRRARHLSIRLKRHPSFLHSLCTWTGFTWPAVYLLLFLDQPFEHIKRVPVWLELPSISSGVAEVIDFLHNHHTSVESDSFDHGFCIIVLI